MKEFQKSQSSVENIEELRHKDHNHHKLNIGKIRQIHRKAQILYQYELDVECISFLLIQN